MLTYCAPSWVPHTAAGRSIQILLGNNRERLKIVVTAPAAPQLQNSLSHPPSPLPLSAAVTRCPCVMARPGQHHGRIRQSFEPQSYVSSATSRVGDDTRAYVCATTKRGGGGRMDLESMWPPFAGSIRFINARLSCALLWNTDVTHIWEGAVHTVSRSFKQGIFNVLEFRRTFSKECI